MFILLLLISFFGIYWLLFFFLPKGNPIHEMIHLPIWWLNMYQLPADNMIKTKYKYGTHFRQYLYFYTPKNGKTTKNNVIVYIHGGGWQFSRPEGFEPNAQEWINEGYCVFMPSHRRIPFYDIDDLREDLNLIIRKIDQIKKEKGLGELKILLGGMSSGANLVALLALDRLNLQKQNIDLNQIAGLFLLGAPLNLNLMRLSPIIFLLAGKKGTAKFKRANPMEYLNKTANFPILGIHGTKDGLVECHSALSFYKKLEAINSEKTNFHILENLTHLNIAGWSFMENGVRKLLFEWLDKREK